MTERQAVGNIQIPMGVCAAVGDLLDSRKSHAKLDALFEAAGLPGPPPNLSHGEKWKVWLYRDLNKAEVDGPSALGTILQEFMDAELDPETDTPEWNEEYETKREKIHKLLSQCGLKYIPGGIVLPAGQSPNWSASTAAAEPQIPSKLDELLERLIKELPRAMYPLTHRRQGATPLSFESEYDIQDLLHSHLRPWVSDIRYEESGPSHAGTTARMDFLLIKHSLVLELKRVRDKAHARRIGAELTIDIDHYRKHPDCKRMWCVVYDPHKLIPNPDGLINDFEVPREIDGKSFPVRVFVI